MRAGMREVLEHVTVAELATGRLPEAVTRRADDPGPGAASSGRPATEAPHHCSRLRRGGGCMAVMRRHDLMLDPFWVGRRGDAFDQTCR